MVEFLALTKEELAVIEALDEAMSRHYRLPILDADERKEFLQLIKILKAKIQARPQEALALNKGTGYVYPH